MEINKKSLLKELEDKANLEYDIPVYQRNYVWKRQNMSKLLEDIKKLINSSKAEHFLGNIIFRKTVRKSPDANFEFRIVVDGQQRLTSIFLIANAIAHIYKSAGKADLAKIVKNKYIINLSNNKYIKLKEDSDSDPIYLKIVNEHFSDLENDKSLLYDNYKFAKETILKWVALGTDLEDVLNAMKKLHVIFVELGEGDNDQEIFESLNNTSVVLDSSDLVRNHILLNKTFTEQEEIYRTYWRKVEDLTKVDGDSAIEKFENSQTSLKDLLKGYLSIVVSNKDDLLIQDRNLFDVFVNHWDSDVVKKNLINKELSLITKAADIYNKFYIASWYDKEIDLALVDIRLQLVDDGYPRYSPLFCSTLISLGLLYVESKISKADFVNSLKIINAFVFRRRIVNLHLNETIKVWQPLARKLYTSSKFDLKELIYSALFDKRSALAIDNVNLRNKIASKQFYSNSNETVQLTRWIFKRIENQAKNVELIITNSSVEHIMPRKLTEQWKRELAADFIIDLDGQKNSILEEDMFKMYLDRLGNLIVLDKNKNTIGGNKTFDDKKKEFAKFNQQYLVSELITKFSKWTHVEIEERESDLVKLIFEKWPFDFEKIINS